MRLSENSKRPHVRTKQRISIVMDLKGVNIALDTEELQINKGFNVSKVTMDPGDYFNLIWSLY